MTDSQREEMLLAMMGRIHGGTGDKLLDHIALELKCSLADDIKLIEPIIDRLIQEERAQRFRMLLEICMGRCLQ